ncbi:MULTISPECIES: hemolysin III family protein [unclassified Granulicatella]|uniref:PAQR family membrane homeostasis protein TrhA n=1 Tax=unclassified Granulicatella TaxID=2630493 RepID=UPI001072F8B4|nr:MULTISPECIES: hemolysin III family protein [unclassified Granulicatella]MBF0779748.1 hemolysin III family protein [Granulicatella sp. 19428wC4_WM01]TFU96266.1 hemolysin III family protein [Granulicatella sp. WM01]
MTTSKLSKQLSIKEEIGNIITHGIGALAMLVLLPISVVYTYHAYHLKAVVGVSIFIISLLLMFLASTIYHSMSYRSTQKYVFRMIDHSMIYIAIAGSYTPVALSLVDGWLGYTIIVIQWSITLFGIFYKIFTPKINEKFSLALYLIMGWLVIFIIPVVLQKSQPIFAILMLAGGLSYTLGAIFYAQRKPFCHLIWHIFILIASVLQYVGIVYFML